MQQHSWTMRRKWKKTGREECILWFLLYEIATIGKPRIIKQICRCLELGSWGLVVRTWWMPPDKYGVSFRDDENVLELENNDGGNFWLYWTLLYTVNAWILWHMLYHNIKLLKQRKYKFQLIKAGCDMYDKRRCGESFYLKASTPVVFHWTLTCPFFFSANSTHSHQVVMAVVMSNLLGQTVHTMLPVNLSYWSWNSANFWYRGSCKL